MTKIGEGRGTAGADRPEDVDGRQLIAHAPRDGVEVRCEMGLKREIRRRRVMRDDADRTRIRCAAFGAGVLMPAERNRRQREGDDKQGAEAAQPVASQSSHDPNPYSRSASSSIPVTRADSLEINRDCWR